MHTIIVGITKFGKTTLCRGIIEKLLAAGKKVAVSDILPPVGWPRGCVFVPPSKLIEFTETERGYFIFCDEASDYIGHNKQYQNIVKKAANYGHYCYMIAQRYKMLHPSTRTQCSAIIAFRQCAEDAKELAMDRAQPAFRELSELAPGEYLAYSNPADGVKKCKMF